MRVDFTRPPLFNTNLITNLPNNLKSDSILFYVNPKPLKKLLGIKFKQFEVINTICNLFTFRNIGYCICALSYKTD